MAIDEGCSLKWDLSKSGISGLYLKQKLLIIKFLNQDILLNKRSEFISKCRHEIKNLIMNVK